MANYTAADVKRLRELTGSGMLDCKKALENNDGDFDKAVEELRIKGAKDVGKRAERSTAEGLVAAKGGAMIELNSETDFVAKNAEFQALADQVLDSALVAKTSDIEELKAAKLGDGTVADAVQALSAKIGEKLELRRVVYYDGPVAVYLHKRASDLPPAVGVLVSYDAAMPLPRPRAMPHSRLPLSRRVTPLATRCPLTSSRTSVASPRRPPRQKASRRRLCRRSSKAV